MHSHLTRRDILAGMAGSSLAAASAASAVSTAVAAQPAEPARPRDPFTYCLNTSTIRGQNGQNVPVPGQVDIAARAGYQAIEPWIPDLERFVQQGGSLRDLGRRISDAGLVVPSAIGFMDWVVDDEARRRRGLETARHAMDMVQQIGGRRLAAPPVGATDQTDLNLMRAAERYRALLEVGARIGVVPQCEVWGFSKALGRLGECVMVALETGHPQACVLADVYHLHKGGSGFAGLHLLGGDALQVFHMNDYPAEPGPATITDAHRVYPGDGVAPLGQMLRDLRRAGFHGVLSLELFNRDYWRQDALTVARTGLDKMRTVVRGSLDA